MNQSPVIHVVCRDGVPALVQRVRYQGTVGGEVYFGKRFPPGVEEFDEDGNANESGDLWNLKGFWKTSTSHHPFDIVRVLTNQSTHANAHA